MLLEHQSLEDWFTCGQVVLSSLSTMGGRGCSPEMLTLDLGCPRRRWNKNKVAKELSGAGESSELSGDRQVSLNEARPPGRYGHRSGPQGSGDPVETPPHPHGVLAGK